MSQNYPRRTIALGSPYDDGTIPSNENEGAVVGVQRCGNCDHPVYRHSPHDLELCRDCQCPGYLSQKNARALGTRGTLDRAIDMVRFAHHEHAFGDEHCTPANCSVSEFLDAVGMKEPQ